MHAYCVRYVTTTQNDALVIGLSVMIAVIVIIIILIIVIVVVRRRKAKTQPKTLDTNEEQTDGIAGPSADLEDPDSFQNLANVAVAEALPPGQAIELSTFVQPSVTVETHAASGSRDLLRSPSPDYIVSSEPGDGYYQTSPVHDSNVFGEHGRAVTGDSLHRGAVSDAYECQHGIQQGSSDDFYEPNDPAQFFDLKNLTFDEEVLRIPRPDIRGRQKVYPDYNLFL